MKRKADDEDWKDEDWKERLNKEVEYNDWWERKGKKKAEKKEYRQNCWSCLTILNGDLSDEKRVEYWAKIYEVTVRDLEIELIGFKRMRKEAGLRKSKINNEKERRINR